MHNAPSRQPCSLSASLSMPIEFHAALDAGRARSNNEDSVAVEAEAGLAVLADGMGGYNAGEVASHMLTSFVSAELGRWLREASRQASDTDVRRAMDICVDNANRAIFNAANANPQYAGMGTTLVLIVFRDTRLLVGHVGDSRCYRLRGEKFEQLTHDHSLLQEQIDSGQITAEQARYSLNKNLVTRALGIEAIVPADISEYRLEPNDIYLLCSDGLTDMVDPEVVQGVVDDKRTELPQAAAELIDLANQNGGRDNISVVLVRVPPEFLPSSGWAQRFLARKKGG